MTTNLLLKTRLDVTLVLSLLTFTLFAQTNVTIEHKTQRFINNVSKLNRSKYVHAYLTIRGKSDRFEEFKKEYNFDPNYIGGRSLTNPASKVTNGNIPSVKNNFNGVRNVDTEYVTGGRPSDLFWNKNTDYSATNITPYSKNLAKYTADALKSEWQNIGRYFEPMNEPMVHAKDFYPGNSAAKSNKIITDICEYHKFVGEAVHGTPELKNVRMTGYASAFPEFERNNFDFWNDRYKKFIDIAGEEMDIFSIHLYDGSGLNNSGGRRSGSNSEALLDMIEAYSFKKLGKVKPIAVTEYGRLVPNQPNWTATNGNSNYEPVTNSQAVRSQLHMVMNFMERGNDFEMGIPFNTNRGTDPTYIYAKASLWTQNSQGKVVLSMRKFFYEMLKDLKGDRVRINSNNVDIQTQAFVDGNKLYVMLNNINDTPQTINLDLVDTKGLQNVNIKTLKVFTNKTPQLNNTTTNTAPKSLKLQYGETAVLTYNFNAPVTFNNKIVSKKYYTKTYLQPIQANKRIAFNFANVVANQGEATLRVGIGRDFNAQRRPIVHINGKKLNYSGDIIRGDDQKGRSRFFGTLEIPLDFSLIKGIKNPKVEISFPDAGGHVSSVILQVQNLDKGGSVDPTPEPPTDVDLPTGQFFIVNRATGMKIRSVDPEIEANPLQLVPAAWSGAPTKWELVDTGDGYFHLRNVETEMYFRPLDNGEVNGSVIVQRPTGYSGGYTRWKQVPTTDGYFYLENKETEMFFRPETSDTYSKLIQRPSDTYRGEWTQWKFVPVSANKELSVVDKETALEINLYPSAINQGEEVNLEVNKDDNVEVSIYSLQGELVHNSQYAIGNEVKLETTDLNSGIYIVNIEVGENTVVEKLIVK